MNSTDPLTFKPIVGDGREARLALVSNHLTQRTPLYRFSVDLLRKIQEGDSKCRLATLTADDSRPAGYFIYNQRLSDDYSHLGFRKGIEIQAFASLPEVREDDFITKQAPLMLQEIKALSAPLQPDSFFITLYKTDQAMIRFFQNNGFQTFTLNPDRPFVFLGQSMSSSHGTKRKAEEPLTPEAPKRVKESSEPSRPVGITLRKIYIHQIRNHQKSVEGRIHSGMFRNLRVGSTVRFFYMANQSDDVVCRIKKINAYGSFQEMIEREGYRTCIPDARDAADAIRQYAAIPGYSEKAAQFGVLALHLEVLP